MGKNIFNRREKVKIKIEKWKCRFMSHIKCYNSNENEHYIVPEMKRISIDRRKKVNSFTIKLIVMPLNNYFSLFLIKFVRYGFYLLPFSYINIITCRYCQLYNCVRTSSKSYSIHYMVSILVFLVFIHIKCQETNINLYLFCEEVQRKNKSIE